MTNEHIECPNCGQASVRRVLDWWCGGCRVWIVPQTEEGAEHDD
jgi:ribosomal protein L37AE/L43A